MTSRSSILKSSLVSRASIIAIVAAASSLGHVPAAQASCEGALTVAPGTITGVYPCAVAKNVNGNVINNGTIGPPGEGDPGFLIGTGGILGSLVNNGTILGGGLHAGGTDEDDGEEEEGYGPTGALTITSNVSLGVTNAGVISSVYGNGLQLGVGGDVEVAARPAGMVGSIVNTGHIGSDYGDGIAALFGTNAGSLTNGPSGLIDGHDAIHIASTFQSWTGGIFNSGTIAGDHSAIRIGDRSTYSEGDVSFSGGIHNNAGGLIQGGTGPSILISGQSFSGGITNAGTITQLVPNFELYDGPFDGEAIVITSHTFGGGITNTGLIDGRGGPAISIRNSVSVFSGDIVNGGTIHGFSDGIRIEAATVNGSISNSGLIDGSSASTGVYVNVNSFNGSISNSGTITGGANGLVVNGGTITGNITNSRLIESGSSGAGVHLGVHNFTGNFTNSGTISGAVTGVLVHVDEFHGNFVNQGLIEGRGFGIDPGYVEIATSHVGDIINNGTLSATTDALRLQIGNLTGGVTNTGLIEATTAGNNAVYISNGNGTTFSNISGGRIAGDVFFAGKNANTFAGGQGSVAGNLFGLPDGNLHNDDSILITGGTQTFNAQSGSGAGNASSFANFTVGSGGVAVLGAPSVGSSGGNGYNLNNVDHLNLNTGGRLYIDNQSALNVGTFTQQAGSTLQFYLSQPSTQAGTPLTNYGTVAATGNVTLGGSLQVVVNSAQFVAGGLNQYDFAGAITTTGSITGNFADEGIAGGSTFYRLQHTINGGSVDLHLSRIAFTAPNCSENANRLGQLLERLYTGGNLNPQEQALFTYLISLPPDQVCDAFDDVGGAKIADLGSVVVETAGPWKNLVNDRLNGLGSVGCNLAGQGSCLNRFAANESAATQTMTDANTGSDPFEWLKTGTRRVGDTGTWGRLVGVWGGTDSKPGSNGTDFTLTGGILGVDHVFSEEWLAGVAMQITTDDIDFQQSTDNASVDSIEVGAYASYGDTRFYVNANTSFIWHDFKVHRDLDNGGAFASYNGTTVSGYAEAGRIFEYDGLRIQPILGASFAHLQTDGYSEHGGAVSLLSVEEADFTTFKSLLGARFALPFELESGRKIVPEARAVWAHEFADDHSAFWARLQAAGPGSDPFQVKGRSYPRDTAIIGAGLTAPLSDEASVTLDYDASINPEMTANTVSAGLRITW